jgi:hypothetical protein
MGDTFLDELLNEAITESFRNNFINLYNNIERTIRNPDRIPLSRLRNTLSSRYYNNPPEGGYQINEEHEYNIDYDDLQALIFLDVTTRFASPVSDTELKASRREKIKEIKYKKVKESSDNECSICLDTIKVGEFEKTLICKHSFHKKCIDRWFKKDNDSCPMCRLNIINLN